MPHIMPLSGDLLCPREQFEDKELTNHWLIATARPPKNGEFFALVKAVKSSHQKLAFCRSSTHMLSFADILLLHFLRNESRSHM